MSHNLPLALTVLLLPIPLAFLIPAAVRAQPDPWKIRRMRISLTGFAGLVALLYGLLIHFQMRVEGSETAPPALVSGIFLWSVMSWFFLATLIWELRRPAPEPFPGAKARAASLVPREHQSPALRWAWRALGATWGLAVVAFLFVSETVPAISILLLGSSFCLLIMGPWLARGQLINSPEPLLPGASADLANHLQRRYAARRTLRTWSIFVLLTISVGYKTVLAFVLSTEATEHYFQPLLWVAAGILFTYLAMISALELFSHRRLAALRRGNKSFHR